jgi:hypothetical protein
LGVPDQICRTSYRLLAFWDKENKEMTLVCGTHGFVKKTDKVSPREIEKAEQIRAEYFHKKLNEK